MKVFTKKLLLFSTIIFSVIVIQVSKNIFAAQVTRTAMTKHVQVKTSQSALVHVQKIIDDVPNNDSDLKLYEKAHADVLLKCAKVLYDNARTQILEALLEIDGRIAYWQFQKDHQWKYFVSKSPLKWVMGPKQEEEIENNLDLLKSHQGELFVLLGQLSELGNLFIQGYKDTFLADYTKGYEWIDTLLNTLSRIKTKIMEDSSPFVTQMNLLKAKLEKVDQFKNDILGDISETAIPPYYTRNWLKYSALMFSLGYGYNRGLFDQLQSSLRGISTGLGYITEPVRTAIQDVFTGGQVGNIDADILYNTSLDLTKNFVRNTGKKYNLEEKAKNAIIGLDNKNHKEYLEFLDLIANREGLAPSEKSNWKTKQLYQDVVSGVAKLSDLSDFAQGKIYFFELLTLILRRQFAAVGKLVLLTPAMLVGWLGYSGYQKLTAPAFGPIRRSLVDVNSLFVDQSKELNDEQYGKMIYLLYNLKKRAAKELTQKNNIREDFIHDLERIESKEFNVASKRAIVEDMFKKYTFLGLIQKK